LSEVYVVFDSWIIALLSQGLFCHFSPQGVCRFVLTPTATSFFASFFAEKKEGEEKGILFN
jgi:hypothetical protein